MTQTDPGGHSTAWAQAAIDALLDLKKATDTARENNNPKIPRRLLAKATRRFAHAARAGISQNLNRHGDLAKKHHALAVRMRDRQADYLRFARDLDVPFDNNQAEVRHEVARDELISRAEGRLMLAA